jgi:hypothetical protein
VIAKAKGLVIKMRGLNLFGIVISTKKLMEKSIVIEIDELEFIGDKE